ncbi:hypothetical protein AAIB41_02505 [Brucella sp. BE17]|uniref:hypothetical protein n=1 Tax=Brucella sp. BE17 TaxID=3142977 RepID=UPI0031BA9D70
MNIFNEDINIIEWLIINVDGNYRIVGLVGGDHEYPIHIVSSPIIKSSGDNIFKTEDQNVYILRQDYPPCFSDKYRNNFEDRMIYVLRDPRRNSFGREIEYKIASLDELRTAFG